MKAFIFISAILFIGNICLLNPLFLFPTLMDVPFMLKHYEGEEVARIPVAPDQFTVDNPRRALGTSEIFFCNIRGIIGSFGLCEEIDFHRATQVTNYLLQQYPFMSSAIVFDESMKWLRYEPQDILQYVFVNENLKQINSFADFSQYTTSTMKIITAHKLTHFEIVKMNIPELPQIKYGLAFDCHHCMFDGSSIAQYFRIFNEIYNDKNFDFSRTPEHIQHSAFRPMCAWPSSVQVNLGDVKLNPIIATPLTGSGNYDISQIKAPVDQPRLVSLEQKDRFNKIEGINFSLSLVAASFALQASYGMWHKDFDNEFYMTTMDVRIGNDQFEKMNPKLDFKKWTLGFSATNCLFAVRGNANTTVLEIAQQLQKQFDARNAKSDQERMLEYMMSDFAPIRVKQNPNINSFILSNLGRQEFGAGPIVQFMGGSTMPNIASMRIGGGAVIGGKYGTIMGVPISRAFSDAENVRIKEKWFEINKICKHKGAANVTISMLKDTLFSDLFD